jgi:hypothetical protein
VSNRVTNLNLLLYEEEYHPHAASVAYKNILGLLVNQSNRSVIQIRQFAFVVVEHLYAEPHAFWWGGPRSDKARYTNFDLPLIAWNVFKHPQTNYIPCTRSSYANCFSIFAGRRKGFLKAFGLFPQSAFRSLELPQAVLKNARKASSIYRKYESAISSTCNLIHST